MSVKSNKQTKSSSFVLLSLLISCTVAISGCSAIGTDQLVENKPKKLLKLEKSPSLIKNIFNSGQMSYNRPKSTKIRPEFDGENVFYASSDGHVYAQTLDNKELWHIETEHQIIGGLSYDVNTQTLIFSTKSGLIVALDGKSGNLKWQRQLSGSVLSPAAISYDLNRVVLSSNNGVLHGLYLKNGLPVWSFNTPSSRISIRGTAIPVLNKDIAVFATADGRINVLEARTGVPIWFQKVGNVKARKQVDYLKDIDASPVFDGENMYTVSYGGKLLALNLKSKSLVFQKKIASSKQLLIVDNLLVVVSNTGEVYCYDKLSGALVWKNDDLMYREPTNPVYIANHITIGDKEGYIHLLDVTTGKVVSREKANGQLDYFEVIGYKLVTQTKNNNVSIWQKKF